MVVVEEASAAWGLDRSDLADRQVVIKKAGLEANHLNRGPDGLQGTHERDQTVVAVAVVASAFNYCDAGAREVTDALHDVPTTPNDAARAERRKKEAGRDGVGFVIPGGGGMACEWLDGREHDFDLRDVHHVVGCRGCETSFQVAGQREHGRLIAVGVIVVTKRLVLHVKGLSATESAERGLGGRLVEVERSVEGGSHRTEVSSAMDEVRRGKRGGWWTELRRVVHRPDATT